MKITIEIEADSVLRDIRSLRINSHGKCFAANYDNDPNKLVVTAIDKALWLLNDLFIHESVERWDERTKEERR